MRRRTAKVSVTSEALFMTETVVWAVPDGEEQTSACPCCGRPIYEGEGCLTSEDGDLADYGYRWAEGHGARFTLGIAPIDEQGARYGGLAVITCRSDGESLIYTILEPEDSPWGDTEAFGPVLTREQVKSLPNIFSFVDAISASESRISTRILELHQ